MSLGALTTGPIVPTVPVEQRSAADQRVPLPLETMYKDMQQAIRDGDRELAEHIGAQIHEHVRDMRQQDVASLPKGHLMAAGAGQAFQDLGMNVRDLVGQLPDPDQNLQDARPTPQEWREHREASEPLLKTPQGAVGSAAGEAALMLPGGVGLEAGMARALPEAVGPLSRALLSGAAQGAATAGPDRRAVGAVEGAAGAGALAGALRAGRRVLVGQTPTPQAALLEREGVPLTVGQRGEGWMSGTISRGEESGARTPLIGPRLERLREDAARGWQNVFPRKATAPGAPAPDPSLPMDEQLQQVHQGYEVPYGQVGREPVYPWTFPRGNQPARLLRNAPSHGVGSIEGATTNRRIEATPADRAVANDWLQNQIAELPTGRQPASKMLGTRSAIREKVRGLSKGSPTASERSRAEMYEGAEDAITGALEDHLPAEAADLLRRTDSQYARKKLLEKAVARAKDRPGGLTPANMSDAIKAESETGAYARGEGPPGIREFRGLARAGKAVLDQKTPTTGALLLGAPAAPLAALANAPGIQSLVKGSTAPQRGARFLENALRSKLGLTRSELIPIAAAAAGGQTDKAF